MFKIINDGVEKPKLYPKIERSIPTVKKRGWVKVDGKKLRDHKDFIPQTGFQEALCTCDADVIFSGGEASSGKTICILMEAMRGLGRPGYSAIILKKELVETKAGGGILTDAKRLYLDIPGCSFTSSDSPTFDFSTWQCSIQLTHLNLQGEGQERVAQEKAKNKQASYIAIDELTNFTFKIWKYWFSRNRDNSGMRPKMICTLNANGWHWSRRMLDWYIGDDNYVIPERIGVKRYFAIQGETVEDIVWGNTKQEVLDKISIKMTKKMIDAELQPEDMIKSFTFIPGNLMDNRILTYNTKGGNVANLFQLGESERKKLMYSYWGESEDAEAMITKAQIRELFSNPWNGDNTMRLSIDIGDGGDASRCWVFKGNQCINIEYTYTSDAVEKAQWIRSLMIKYKVRREHTVVDAGGGGNYIDDYLKGVVGVLMQSSPLTEYDEDGNILKFEQYVNLRSQMLGKLSAMINAQEMSIAIDKNTVFKHGKKGSRESTLIDIITDQAIGCLRRIQKPTGKYYFISKDEYKHSRGESPDDLDCMAMVTIFFLDARLKKRETYIESDYAGLYELW